MTSPLPHPRPHRGVRRTTHIHGSLDGIDMDLGEILAFSPCRYIHVLHMRAVPVTAGRARHDLVNV